CGLLLALFWVRLAAPDVALTEAAIGGGLTGVLLIGAAARVREAGGAAEKTGALTRVVAALLSAAVAAAIAYAVLALPDPAPTLAPAAAEHIGVTGLGNPITAVLLAFRAIDTLLETVVVVFALIGVWSLTPDAAWGARPALPGVADPAGPAAFAARVLAPIGVVVGVYLLWVGADEPGGKFQAATVLAAMALLLMLSGIMQAPPVGHRGLRAALVAGPLVFVAIGIAGVAAAGAFLAYPEPQAKALIMAIEVALTASLALLLVLLLAGPPRSAPR
ncbi:MAG TPA: hydrogenase subunit MbhD domain-containing protein, partial [Pelomicrobium sp.]|nr:hydrogenase subunit MbhD domain-containing protein [Pelomicrobium sp.]